MAQNGDELLAQHSGLPLGLRFRLGFNARFLETRS